jgi:hypothetical protein
MADKASSSKGDVMMKSGNNMPDVQRHKGSFKTTATGAECDGGTKDRELEGVASRIYKSAVANRGSGGDKALQER